MTSQMPWEYVSCSPLYGEGGGRGEGEKLKTSFISQHPGLSEGKNVPGKGAECLDIHGEALDLGGGGGIISVTDNTGTATSEYEKLM